MKDRPILDLAKLIAISRWHAPQAADPTKWTDGDAFLGCDTAARRVSDIKARIKNLPMFVRLSVSSGSIARTLSATILTLSGLGAAEHWIDAYRAHRFDEALSISDQAIKQLPRDPKAWTERAMALAALGRNDESIGSFERAINLQPAFLPALEGGAELTYRTHDPRAGDFISKLLKVDPHNSTANSMAGVLAFERKDCLTAKQHFENSGPGLVDHQQAYSLYGACLLKLGRAEQAVPVFSSLLAQVPGSTNARYNLGYAQLSSGNTADAVTTLRPLALAPQADASALNLLASAEAANGDLSSALEHLRTAARLKPEEEENYLDFASLCLEHNSPDLAEEIINIGLKNIPNSARLYSMRGIVNAQRNKHDESASDFEQANRLNPDKSYGAVGLSMLYAESKRPQEAERLLRQKLTNSPNDPTLNYLLADVLVNQIKQTEPASFAEAKAALLRSLAGRPNFSNAHALLGKVYRHTGDNSAAIRQFRIALDQSPENRVALSQIVSLLRASGHQEESLKYSTTLRHLLENELKDEVNQSRLRIVRAE